MDLFTTSVLPVDLFALTLGSLTLLCPRARLYAFPLVKILHLVLCKIREERASVIFIAVVSQATGTIWHPSPELWSLHAWLLPWSYSWTFPLTESCAASIRRLCALKWRVFVNWCCENDIDPASCPVSDVLGFLQHRLDNGSHCLDIGGYFIPRLTGNRSGGTHWSDF